MTPQAQRIAIAEACPTVAYLNDEGDWCWREKARPARFFMPLTDLNAITAAARYCAERVMNADQWEDFGKLLSKAHPTAVLLNHVGDKTTLDYYDLATLMTGLTAAQYAECLLKALGKWTE